jgi:hypothetical protein
MVTSIGLPGAAESHTRVAVATAGCFVAVGFGCVGLRLGLGCGVGEGGACVGEGCGELPGRAAAWVRRAHRLISLVTSRWAFKLHRPEAYSLPECLPGALCKQQTVSQVFKDRFMFIGYFNCSIRI